MIVSNIRINAQINRIADLEDQLDDILDKQLILEKQKEIEAEESKLVEMEAEYEGRGIERQKPWEKKREEVSLLSFC